MSASNLHHSFDVHLAAEHGLEEAILIHHFQYWITLNKNMNRNFIDGRTWTYQTRKFITAVFPYLNERKVRYACKNLEKKGILVCKNFNKSQMDTTLWYAFAEENKFIAPKSNNVCEEQNCPSTDTIIPSVDKIANAIPDTISISSNSISDDVDDAREKTRATDWGNVHSVEGQSIPSTIIEKTKPNGQKVQCSQGEYFKYCVNTHKDFKTEEILTAWSRLCDFSGAIGNWMKYLDQIIFNNRQNEKLCNSQMTNEKTEKKESKKERELSCSSIAEKDMKKRPSPKLSGPLVKNLKYLSEIG